MLIDLLGTFGKRRDHGITDLIKYRAKGKVRANYYRIAGGRVLYCWKSN
jgi:hypothetical protein